MSVSSFITGIQGNTFASNFDSKRLEKWKLKLRKIFQSTTDQKKLMECVIKYIEYIINYSCSLNNRKEQIAICRKYLQVVEVVISTEYQNAFIQELCQKIFDIIMEEDANSWGTKKELLIVFTQCARKVDKHIRQKTISHLPKIYLFKLFDSISTFSDFDLQVLLIETLFCMYGKEKIMSKLKDLIPESEELSENFASINRDTFYENVRKFLNILNEISKKIFSIKCCIVKLGSFTCVQNIDELEGIWVNFNLLDKAVSWYCCKSTFDAGEDDDDDPVNSILLFSSDIKTVMVDSSSDRTGLVVTFKLKDSCICTCEKLQQYVDKCDSFIMILKDSVETRKLISEILPQLFRKKFLRDCSEQTKVSKSIKCETMPRKYKKKTPGRNLISEEKIITAKKLIEKGKSKRYAAEFVGINEATLRKRLKSGHVPLALGRFRPTFTQNQESEFATHCQAMDERFFGITINDLRRLAYEFALANKIENRFDGSSRTAGRDWVEGFLKRNEHLGLRQSAPVSLARAIGFNKAQVEKFYKNLKDLYEKHKFRPHRIYNMDETGMSTVPKKTPKVVARKGKKVVGKIVSAERGMTITAVMCMSATGHFVPPALIFPRKRPKAELLDGGPTGTICMVSESGFINTTLFVNWLYHFKDFVHPTREDPVLLVLDNHSSHISLEGATYAREHHIVMLTIPPHGSHKIQPLDVAVHGPLKSKYSIECEKWMNRHPGRGITQFQVAGLFYAAYKHVATMGNAESGFRATGIYPYADDLFDETDFAPSTVTDQNPSNATDEALSGPTLLNDPIEIAAGDHNQTQQNEVEDLSQNPSNDTDNDEALRGPTQSNEIMNEAKDRNQTQQKEIIDVNQQVNDEETDKSETSNNTASKNHENQRVKSTLNAINTCSNVQMVTVAQLSPLPRMVEKKKRTRISLKSEILTSSPYKKQLEEKKKTEEEKKLKKHRKQVNFDESTSTQKKKPNLKRVATEPQPGTSGLKPQKIQSGKDAKKQNKIRKTKSEEVFCPICGEKYEDPPNEHWIECIVCHKWFHADCTAYEIGMFRCDFCNE